MKTLRKPLRPVRILTTGIAAAAMGAIFASPAEAANLFWKTDGTGGTLTSANWGTTAVGPFTSAWANSSDILFTANSAITNVTNTPVGNITISPGVTVTLTAAGTYSTGAGIRTVDIGAGGLFVWNGQGVSTTAGTGFVKNGTGTWNIGAQGNTYPGGFTLNAGTVIVGGVNALGAGGALAINGGIIAPNTATARTFTGKYTGGISVGGDFQFGDAVNVTAGTGNLTYDSVTSLGAATRTVTIGGNGIYTLGGVISGAAGTGLNIAATGGATGVLAITNAANTFTGPVSITGGDARFTSDGSFGAVPGGVTDSISINGGTLSTATNAAFTLNPNRSILLGSAGGTISTTGATSNLVIGGIIKDITSSGNFTKSGPGVLELSADNTYTGSTTVSAGTLKLTGIGDISGGALSVKSGAILDVTGVAGAIFGTASTQPLSGAGTLSAAGKVFTFGGSVSPGDATPGDLTFSGGAGGTLSLASNSSFIFDLGTASDRVALTGTSTLDIGTGVLEYSDFTFNVGAGFSEGTYTLFSGATTLGVGNALGGALSGSLAGFNATLALSGNDVVLNVTAVPEPGSAALLLGAIAILGARRRR